MTELKTSFRLSIDDLRQWREDGYLIVRELFRPDEMAELSRDQLQGTPGVKLILQPGDIAIFDGFTPHCSGPNLSDGWRRQLYLSYNAASDGGDQRDTHYEEFRQYLKRRYAEYQLEETYFR